MNQRVPDALSSGVGSKTPPKHLTFKPTSRVLMASEHTGHELRWNHDDHGER